MGKARASDFHLKHNIYFILEDNFPNIEPFGDIVPFLRESRIFKALTERHKCYESHVRTFLNAAHYEEEDKAIHSTVRIKDDKKKDVDLPVKIIVEDVRRVLNLQDKDEDPIIIPERLCKGFWLRMGYTWYIYDKGYIKSKFCRPYKFLVHCVIHELSHRKGVYNETSDYVMNIIACLVLNRPYNISQVIFNHMIDNTKGEKYIMYPRFVQMLLDDQIPNLPKDPNDELPLKHMDSETLERLDKCRGVKPEDEPRYRQKFRKIKKSDYVAPEGDNWRHANSNSENETERLEPMRKRTPKVSTPKVVIKGKIEKQESSERLVDNSLEYYTKSVNICVAETKKKKSPQHLVDEPVIPPTEVIKKGSDLLKMPSTEYEKLSSAQGASVEKEVEKTGENVEAGGENVEKTFVEGLVHTDSSETESDDIDPTMIAPMSYQSPNKVEDPASATKKATSQSSSHGFRRVPHDLGARPIGLDDVGDVLNEGKINALERKLSILEKAKAKAEAELEAAKEKLEVVEAETVALRIEIEDHAEVIDQLTEEIEEVNVQYKTIDNANKMLHEMVGDLHVSTSKENDILRKEIEGLRADNAIKDEHLNMLYTVIESKLGINVQAVYDELEIQRVKARRIEREKRLA
ncbi:hypothetical protein Hanom_Chr10g00912691 [Helianthus anomalus]